MNIFASISIKSVQYDLTLAITNALLLAIVLLMRSTDEILKLEGSQQVCHGTIASKMSKRFGSRITLPPFFLLLFTYTAYLHGRSAADIRT